MSSLQPLEARRRACGRRWHTLAAGHPPHPLFTEDFWDDAEVTSPMVPAAGPSPKPSQPVHFSTSLASTLTSPESFPPPSSLPSESPCSHSRPAPFWAPPPESCSYRGDWTVSSPVRKPPNGFHVEGVIRTAHCPQGSTITVVLPGRLVPRATPTPLRATLDSPLGPPPRPPRGLSASLSWSWPRAFAPCPRPAVLSSSPALALLHEPPGA